MRWWRRCRGKGAVSPPWSRKPDGLDWGVALALRGNPAECAWHEEGGFAAAIIGYPRWTDNTLADLARGHGNAAALIDAFRRHGTDLLQRISGHFAFAIVEAVPLMVSPSSSQHASALPARIITRQQMIIYTAEMGPRRCTLGLQASAPALVPQTLPPLPEGFNTRLDTVNPRLMCGCGISPLSSRCPPAG